MIHDNLRRIAHRSPAGGGLYYRDRFEPYTALAERVERLAAGLMNRGVSTGMPVAVLVPNSPDLFVIVHALFAIGAIALPLSTGATRDEVLAAIGKSDAGGLIVRPELINLADDVMLSTSKVLPIFTSGGEGDMSIGQLERSVPGRVPQLPGETTALYMLSSGSTGLPKIVPHSHAELLADAQRTSRAWALGPDDRVFNMLPGNFAMGLLLGATNAAEAGASTIYWNDPRPLMLARQRLIDTIAGEKISFMAAVPAMYETMMGAPGEDKLTGMRLAVSGGTALKRRSFEGFRNRFGLPLRQAYGSTEAIMFSFNDDPDIEGTWASVGRPAGDGAARIAPMETGLGEDVGELIVRSSSLMAGYLGDDAANAASFSGDWLRTGDLARIDAAGRIFIVGRSKLLIEVSGYKIDPFEVEDVLVAHPGVAEAAVVGHRRSPTADQQLKAVVVRRDAVSADQLIGYLRGRLSAHKVPTLIVFIEALPKSSAGKVLRGQLSDRA